MKTVNNVNNDIVNSTNNDIQNVADVSTASEIKTVHIDTTTDQFSSGCVSKLTGFRFLDLEILSIVASSLCCCSTCNQTSFSLSENLSRKKGLAEALVIECFLCYYNNNFYTSKRNSKAFGANVRPVYYCMKACGRGYARLEKFAALINFPRPMSQNSYRKL